MATLVNQILGLLTIAGDIVVVGLVVLLVLQGVNERASHQTGAISNLVANNAILFSLIVVVLATAGRLFYSEIAGYEPCKLCWFQRIFMYPQVVLLSLALWKRDSNISLYSLWLSGIGAVIAGYHYLLQIGVTSGVPCAAVGYSASCSQRFVLQHGYITIPMMAFTAFLMIAVFMVIQRKIVLPKR